MEETKIAETAMDMATNGNLKVVLITAALTAGVTAGTIFAVNKAKKAVKKRKSMKRIKQVPFTVPEEVKEAVESL